MFFCRSKGKNRFFPFPLFKAKCLKYSAGFTLIELSIVLVVLGIFLSLGANVLGPLLKRAKLAEDRETVKTMKEAIIAHSVSRKELPCGTADTCTLADGDKRFNVLSKARDGYRNPLFFLYATELRREPGNLNLCSVQSTSLTLRVCHNAGCSASDSIPNVAFVVGSRGANLNKQMNGNDRITTATITAYDPEIPGVPDGDTSGIDRNEEFDDVYAYVTLSELQAKIPCIACTAYEVYNGSASPTADFKNNLTNTCYLNVGANAFITSVGAGGSIERYAAGTNCSGVLLRNESFSSALSTDTNRNCQVNSTIAGLSDR